MELTAQNATSVGQRFRKHMPIAQKCAYLDNAAVAPLSAPACKAISDWSAEALLQAEAAWSGWVERVERARGVAAALVNAEPDEIAFVSNTTSGVSLVAEGFPWEAGDNVVLLGNEFPSNVYPWMNLASRGVDARRVALTGAAIHPDELLSKCDARTRILAISWVGFVTGWRFDVEETVRLAHQRGILVFLDAIQGLGVFPLDVRRAGVDFFAADGHKWLLGPEGAGIFFLRREHLDLLRPLGVGWNSVVQAHDFSRIEFKLRLAAARYEGGSQNMAGLLGLGASLGMLSGFGLTPHQSLLAERVRQVTAYACQRLEACGAEVISDRRGENWSGIIAFDLPGRDHHAARKRCLEQNVILSCRGGHLRISPHAYAHEKDIDRLIENLGR